MNDIAIMVIRHRIEMGYMPKNLDHLIERRGSIEKAALDVAQFTGYSYEECLEAPKEVYL